MHPILLVNLEKESKEIHACLSQIQYSSYNINVIMKILHVCKSKPPLCHTTAQRRTHPITGKNCFKKIN